MDIRLSEHEKRMFRLGLTLLKKKVGKKAEIDNVHDYLMSSKSEALKETVKLIDFIADNTKNNYQSRTLRTYGKYGLWLCCNNESLRKALENLLSRFTKFNNVKIDLKPNMSKFEQYLLEKIMIHTIKKISSKPTYVVIANEAIDSPNPINRYIMNNIDECFDDLGENFIHKAMKSFIWIALWIAAGDTAYRSQYYYGIKKLGNEDLSKLADDFFYEPKDWYINVHFDAHEKTKKLWKENKIPMHENAFEENPCMPKKQQEKINRIIKEIGGAK